MSKDRCLYCGRKFRHDLIVEHEFACGVERKELFSDGAEDRQITSPIVPFPKPFVTTPLQAPQKPFTWRGQPIGGFPKLNLGQYIPHHHADWVRVGKYRIMGCGKNGKGMVGLRVMLDSAWLKPGMVLSGSRSRAGNDRDAVYVHWYDQGVISLPAYRQLIGYIVARLREGAQVSVGCIGGHGRTGTVLAGVLAVLENLSGEQAINEIRKRYCNRAVETTSQVNLVRALRGESLLPTVKATVSSYWQEDLTSADK